MIILIDNGHGESTPGKRSPDGTVREWECARDIARELWVRLCNAGLRAACIVPQADDVPLADRARIVNDWCAREGKENVALVSIHCNAAGNGSQWMAARGWEAWTSPGETAADALAECLYDAAADAGFRIRVDRSDGDDDKEGRLYLLRHTLCPAVLTENLFMDNREDAALLASEEGRCRLAQLHADGILRWLEQRKRKGGREA